MVRANQISIDEDSQLFTCDACDERMFVSEHSLFQHVRSRVHEDEWCERCEWLFVSAAAREAHVRDSSHHWLCPVCGVDEEGRTELADHCITRHSYCLDCNTFFRDEITHRLERHFACPTCSREFNNSNELTMHQQVHLPRNKECYGCARKFATHSAIIIHLESGSCNSNIDQEDIDQWAFECDEADHYTNDWDSPSKYRCPTCDDDFERLSALFQHVESPCCDEEYDDSLLWLVRFLERQAIDRITQRSESSGGDFYDYEF